MDLRQLSQSELLSLLKQVSVAIQHHEHKVFKQAQDQIRAIAQQVGMPLKDILGIGSPYPLHKRNEKVPMRYRHPDNPNLQWSGRGRSPGWVLKWEIEHGSRQDLLITTTGEEKDAQ